MIEDHRKTITVLTDCLRDSASATTRAARTLAGHDTEGASDADLYAMIDVIEENFKAVKAGASNVKTLRDTIQIVRLKIENIEKSGQGLLALSVPMGGCTNCGSDFAACRELIEADGACCDACIHPEVKPESLGTTAATATDGDTNPCRNCGELLVDCNGKGENGASCCSDCRHDGPTAVPSPADEAPATDAEAVPT